MNKKLIFPFKISLLKRDRVISDPFNNPMLIDRIRGRYDYENVFKLLIFANKLFCKKKKKRNRSCTTKSLWCTPETNTLLTICQYFTLFFIFLLVGG